MYNRKNAYLLCFSCTSCVDVESGGATRTRVARGCPGPANAFARIHLASCPARAASDWEPPPSAPYSFHQVHARQSLHSRPPQPLMPRATLVCESETYNVHNTCALYLHSRTAAYTRAAPEASYVLLASSGTLRPREPRGLVWS